MTNPPFGEKSTITIVNEEGKQTREAASYHPDDFWTTPGNKQLNFLQHVKPPLKIQGHVAIVMPKSVLFEGGAAKLSGTSSFTNSMCVGSGGFPTASFTPKGRGERP